MSQGNRHKFRRLAEAVFFELVDVAKDEIGCSEDPGEDTLQIIEYFTKTLMNDGNLIQRLLKKNRGKMRLTDEEIGWLVKAFKESFERLHFEEIAEALTA